MHVRGNLFLLHVSLRGTLQGCSRFLNIIESRFSRFDFLAISSTLCEADQRYCWLPTIIMQIQDSNTLYSPPHFCNVRGRYAIRLARDADAASMVPLVGNILEQYKLPLLLEDGDRALTCLHTYYAGSNHGQCWIVVDETTGDNVGLFALYHVSAEECELQKMFLSADHRGKGLGMACLQYFIEEARQRGYVRVVLDTVSVLKEAVSLYEKVGFKTVTGCESQRWECDIVMELQL
jgi:GNAT superfamily N-acetyltransferase